MPFDYQKAGLKFKLIKNRGLLTVALIVCVFKTAFPQWTTHNLSVARSSLVAISIGDKAFFAGGTAESGHSTDVIDIYDKGLDTWSSSTLSAPRSTFATASAGNKLFFGGGLFDGGSSSVVDVYDNSSNTWSAISMPTPRHYLAAAGSGSKVFFAGGLNNNHVTDVVEIYDTNTNTWTTEHLSSPRMALAATSNGTKVFFAGGYDLILNQQVYSAVVDIYDTSTGTWSTGSLSEARGYATATSLGSKIFFAGGYGLNLSNKIDIYDVPTDQWTVKLLTHPRTGIASTASGTKVFFAGGADITNNLKVVDIYDINTKTWSISTLSVGRNTLAATSIGPTVFFAGGYVSGVSSLIDIYDTSLSAPFKVAGLTPSPHNQNVGVDTSIKIDFTDPVLATTISGKIVIVSNVRGKLAGNILTSGATVTFQPSGALLHGEEITVDVLSGITSLNGDPLNSPFTAKFKTSSGIAPSNPPGLKSFPLSVSANSPIPVDLDIDGDIDIVTEVYWMENTGTGQFTTHQFELSLGAILEVGVADLDSDGDMDIASAGFGGMYWYENNAMQFTRHTLNNEKANQLSLADINQDGFFDIVYGTASGNSPNRLAIFANDGNGNFTETFWNSQAVWDIHTNDLDNDGKPDIIIGDSDGAISLYRNNGGLSFSHIAIGAVGNFASSAVTDLNQDGYLDVLVAGDRLVYFQNDPNQNFTIHNIISPSISKYMSIQAGDLDGDGDIDLLSDDYSVFFALENKGGGSFARTNIADSSLENSSMVDIDQDGDIDILACLNRFNGVTLTLFKNVPLYEVSPFSNVTPAGFISLLGSDGDWGDYDNDGDLDYLTTGLFPDGTTGAKTYLYQNTGNGFVQVTHTMKGFIYGSCEWGDYDNDGDLDVLMSGATSNDINNRNPLTEIYINTAGTFAPLTLPTPLPGAFSGEASWADLNQDGRLDLVVIGNNISTVFESLPNNTFRQAAELQSMFQGANVSFGDYDNDGDTDFAISGWTGTDAFLGVYRNEGNWVFAQISSPFQGIIGGNLNWLDYDSDGDLDLLASGERRLDLGGLSPQNIPSNSLYENTNGIFNLVANLNIPGVSMEGSAAIGDFTNDGHTDILTSSGSGFGLYENSGNKTFLSHSPEIEPNSSGFLAISDYDNDHDLDVAVNGTFGRIHRNNIPHPNVAPSAPLSIGDSVANNIVYLYWAPGSDSETPVAGLSYQPYIGSHPDTDDILVSHSNLQSGKRKITTQGIAKSRLWKLNNLKPGTYYAGVQTIDASLESSAFIKQSFKVIRITEHNGCSNTIQSYSAEPVGNYTWTVRGGTIVQGQGSNIINVLWGNAGNGVVSISDGTSSNYIRVYIDPKPQTKIVGPDKICENSNQDYSVQFTNQNKYHWSTTSGTIGKGSETNMMTATWKNLGSSKIKVAETSAHSGCIVLDSMQVTIFHQPIPAITGEFKICIDTLSHLYSTSNYAGDTYTWELKNPVPDAGHFTAGIHSNASEVRWTKPGSWTLSVTENSAGNVCTATTSAFLTILPLPTPHIQSSGNKLFTESASAYQWYLNDVPIESPIDPAKGKGKELEASRSGLYKVVSTDIHGCKGQSDAMNFVFTDVELNPADSWNLFPIPAHQETSVTIKNSFAGKVFVRFLDSGGRVVKVIQINKVSIVENIEVSLEDLANGVYLVELTYAETIETKKLVVIH